MHVDPDSWPGLVLRLAGMGTFLVVSVGTILALLIALVARSQGNRVAARRGALVAAGFVATWVLAIVLGPIVLRGKTLAPDDELVFCGFDCHLHVAAVHATRDSVLRVTVRARSDALAVPEDPGLVDLYVVDRAGVHYAPDTTLAGLLGPGESYERTLHFAVPPDADSLRLVGTWKGWAARLIPGPDHVLVQRQAGIAIQSQRSVS